MEDAPQPLRVPASSNSSLPPQVSIKQLKQTRGVHREKLLLALVLTSWRSWGKDPGNVFFPYFALQSAHWPFLIKYKNHTSGTTHGLGVSRGLPMRPVEGTRNFFCPSSLPQHRMTAVSHKDLDLTLYWCHWCQNWASVYKQIQSSLLLCHNGSRLFFVFMPAKCFPVGPECSPGIGDKPPLNAFRNVFLGIRPRSQRNFLLVKN